MGRLIVLIVLVVVAVWLIRRALRGPAQKTNLRNKVQMQGELVRCAHCGMHLPRSEARETQGMLFCSDEHARLGKR